MKFKQSIKSIFVILLTLFVGVNYSFGQDVDPEKDYFWAQITAKPSSITNGSGGVYASKNDGSTPEYNQVSSTAEDAVEFYAMTSLVSSTVDFDVFARANDGNYFKGWSFIDGNIDLGGSREAPLRVKVMPADVRGKAHALNHFIYAAFEPIQLVSYEVTGSNTTSDDGDGNMKCTQTVRFRAETPGAEGLSSVDDIRHFKLPVVTPKEGTYAGWTTDVTEWVASKNIDLYGSYAILTVQVTFTAPNNEPAEFGANLVLETKAGVKTKVYLSARNAGGEGEAVLYDKSNVVKEKGDLTNMLEKAASTDIVKLNADYSGPVEINKSLVFDLNGYSLSNTLTITGDNVTLAYSPYGGSVDEINITDGKTILNGGTVGILTIGPNGEAEQNGATITGVATNNGILTTTAGVFQKGLTSSKSLIVNGGTFTNNSGIAIDIKSGTAQIKKGTINGSTYGIQSAGTTTIEKLAAISGSTKALNGVGGSLTVNNGKFTSPNNLIAGSVTFNAGYFQSATGPTALGKQVWRNTAGPEAREGYNFFVGSQEAAQASNVSVCRIGTTAYSSLEDALSYANNNPNEELFIFMENNYVLPAGYYTLPAKATLVVPMSDDQTTVYKTVERVGHKAVGNPVQPTEFRCLTLANGANLDVRGKIELSCKQYVGSTTVTGIPYGPYGHLVLEEGSHMTLQDGSELRAWGYMTGKGETDARRGAMVREQFQMGDWKGGTYSLSLVVFAPVVHLFPIYEYFIQNVESPIKYHPGAILSAATGVEASPKKETSVLAYADDIKIIGVQGGDKAMFFMDNEADADNTWVRKFYDATKDQQVYDVNSGASLGSMVIDLGKLPEAMMGLIRNVLANFLKIPADDPKLARMDGIKLNSADFILPITNNMKIHLLSGQMEFTQSTALLPGAEVEVDKESVISIVNNTDPEVCSGVLYVYDDMQWGQYVQPNYFATVVNYSATLDAKPAVRPVGSAQALGDAIINVHGTFNVGEGMVYTTADVNNYDPATFPDNVGANIFSSNDDAGTFVFSNAPRVPDYKIMYDDNGMPTYIGDGIVIQWQQGGPMLGIASFSACTSARLKQGDGSYAKTDEAQEGDAFCYQNNEWSNMTADECFMVKHNVATGNIYYAKPAEYVALANGKTCNADHTYSDADGAGRLFILTSGCQWWEVEKKDNLYHCIHPNNDTYYSWDDDKEEWKEQRFTITWKNWDGTIIETTDMDGNPTPEYSVTYGTMAEFLGTNPTREATNDYTYDFTGWSPALGPVTSDVTYTATYEPKPRKYTIIFQQEGGVEIERQFLTLNEVPVCENTPTKVGHTLVWSPAIAAVTGDATYTATWEEEPPTKYKVTFFDYDGKKILKQGNVNVGDMPEAPADPIGKAEWAEEQGNKEFTYVFDHWSPKPEIVSATSIKSYTAVYREVAKTYTIIFKNENGSEIERHEYKYGETPVCSATPSKEPTAQYTYTFAWTPQIETVREGATYKATFTPVDNKYTVTLISSIPGAATFTGTGIYKYGETAEITIAKNDAYKFIKWDDESKELIRSITVTDDITLTAIMQTDAEDETVDLDETFDGAGKTVKNLILKSNTSQSGEITGASSLKIDGQAYFDLTLNAAAQTWYAFAVPWKVDATSGVSVLNGAKLELDRTYHVLYYDGANRAAHGKAQGSWKFLADKADKTLEPGVFYLIYLNNSATTLRFTKKAGASINTISVMVQQYPSQTGNDADANWNGIANPAVYRAYMNAGVDLGQKYESGAIEMSSHEFIVGEPIFVQVPAKKTVIAVDGSYPAAAPSRWLVNSAEEPHQSFDIRIAAKDADYSDRLFVKTATDKADKYIIGQDLAKISVSKKAAQFWVDRYDAQLCVNTQAVDNDQAFFPLGIFAPTNGQYTISSATALANNEELFVTIDGAPVWNLGAGAYTIDLAAGNTTEYGLMVVYHPAPEVTTGCENIEASENASVRKVLINGQVFILRDGAVYTIFGQKAK